MRPLTVGLMDLIIAPSGRPKASTGVRSTEGSPVGLVRPARMNGHHPQACLGTILNSGPF
jgi:hypothetical protein